MSNITPSTAILLCTIDNDNASDIIECVYSKFLPIYAKFSNNSFVEPIMINYHDMIQSTESCRVNDGEFLDKNACVHQIFLDMSQGKNGRSRPELDNFCDTYNKDHTHKQGKTPTERDLLTNMSAICKPWGKNNTTIDITQWKEYFN